MEVQDNLNNTRDTTGPLEASNSFRQWPFVCLPSRFYLLFVSSKPFASVVDFLTQLGHLQTKGVGSEISLENHGWIEAETHGGVSEG
jgi:hypothetical protein